MNAPARRLGTLPAIVHALALLVGCTGGDDAGSGPGQAGSTAAGGSGLGGAGAASSSGGSDAGAGGLGGSGVGGVSAAGAGAVGADCASPPVIEPTTDPAQPPEADPALAGETHAFFTIHVRDADTGNPIPGAELRTVNKIILFSDDQGVVAFWEPGLMDHRVFFSVTHPGWEHTADLLGVRGRALDVVEGGSGEITLQRRTGQAAPAQGDLPSRLASGPVPGPDECMAIRVMDPTNGRGVPYVSLSAFGEAYWSDSQGMIAFCHPDHVGQEIDFELFTHGYELPGGASGVTLSTSAGGSATVELARTNVAERLYRITGAGIYAASVRLDLATTVERPVLNGQVMGSDTGSMTTYRGQLFWLWQDTDRVSYPLGNFRGTAAVSALPGNGGLDPDLGANAEYFVGTDGFAKGMCEAADLDNHPVWMAGLISVPDAAGEERLFAGYAAVDSAMAPVELGLAEFDDQTEQFERILRNFGDTAHTDAGFVRPDGHPFPIRHGNETFIYYPDRDLRIPATAEAMRDPSSYQVWSAFGEDGSTDLVLDGQGDPVWAWRRAARRTTRDALAAAGLGADHALDGHRRFVGAGGGLALAGGGGHMWSPYRKRFLQIAQILGGPTSTLGDLVHAEADTPMGPWVYARQVVGHDNYSFYNVLYHPEFVRAGGRYAYFEGSYTAAFTDAEPTPRYDYNQIMYRLDLEDERVVLPVAVYDVGADLPGEFVTKGDLRPGAPALAAPFFALDRPTTDTAPVAWSGAACEPRTLVVGGQPPSPPIFHAVRGDGTAPPNTVGLYEYAHADGRRAYGLDAAPVPDGFTRSAAPLVWVWENPIAVPFPVGDYLGDLVADAGPDQCVIAGADGAEVTLDATGTTSAAIAIASTLWRLPPGLRCEYLEGQQVTVTLPPGLHAIELRVTDEAGNVSTDAVLVSVQ